MSLEWPLIPKSDVKQHFNTITANPGTTEEHHKYNKHIVTGYEKPLDLVKFMGSGVFSKHA